MKVKFSESNKAKVEDFLATPSIRKSAEEELGLPIRVVVQWDNGMVCVQGSKAHKIIPIKDILDCYEEGLIQ